MIEVQLNGQSYQPTVTPNSGVFVDVSASGEWVRIGDIVKMNLTVIVEHSGTAGGWIEASLPFPSAGLFCFGGRNEKETALSGTTNGSVLQIQRYDGRFPEGRVLTFSGIYEAVKNENEEQRSIKGPLFDGIPDAPIAPFPPPPPPAVFDAAESERAKEDGIVKAMENNATILHEAREIAVEIAKRTGKVDADKVTLALVERGYGVKCLGNSAGSLFRDKRFEPVPGEFTKATRVQSHSNRLMVWRLKR